MTGVAALAGRYLDEKGGSWMRVTCAHVRRDLRVFVSFLGDNAALSQDGVVAFVRHMRARTWKGQPLAPATTAGVFVSVKGFLKWATDRGHLLEDLAPLIEVSPVRSLPRTLPEDQVVQLIERGASGRCAFRDRALLEVLYGTGIRSAEAARLTLDDVDLHGGFVHVKEGKNRKDRVVPLGERARDAVLDYLRHERCGGGGRLFLTRDGRPLSRTTVGSIVWTAGRKAGLPGPASPHRLRHSCATHMLRGGADIVSIKGLLGHASLASTQVYLSLDISDLTRMIETSHPRERERRRA